MGQTDCLEYTVTIWEEGGQYLAHAMPLDVASSGETPDEARRALDEAVRLFLATAADTGTIDEVLAEAGYECREGRWEGPSWVATERHSVAIGL